MEITNWINLIMYSGFTMAVIFIGIPSGIYTLYKGLFGLIKFGCCKKLPKYFICSGYGKTSLEILFGAIFTISVSIWYLFIDKGGHLFYCIKELKEFFI